MNDASKERVREILRDVKSLAGEYYVLTGKPLGVTGEVAEYIVAEKLGLELAPPRTKGYDAIRRGPNGDERIQIKARAFGKNTKSSQRVGAIKRGSPCDSVMLALLSNDTLEPVEIWEAPMTEVEKRLAVEGSKARERGALGVSEFIRMARRVWVSDTEQEGNLRGATDKPRGKTTEPGYINRNRQIVVRRTDLPGNDHGQMTYVLKCEPCSHQYGANGSDIWLRRCPKCSGGAPGLPIS